MKKWITALLVLMMMSRTACAKTYTFSDPEEGSVYYVCEDFAGELPNSAKEAFSDVLREGDEVICGTIVLRYRAEGATRWSGSAVVALRRDDALLLLGAKRSAEENENWNSAIESDSFLPEGREMTMTAIPYYFADGGLREVKEAIIIENETICLDTVSDGVVHVWEYICEEPDGTQNVSTYGRGLVDWGTRADRKKMLIYGDAGPIPSRLCAWTYDTLPRSQEESEAWTAPYSFDLAADEGYLSGVNLREHPTGKSKSFGIYRAKVQILDQKPGEKDPWMKVRVGNLIGWASGRYLHMQQWEDPYGLAEYQTAVKKVGRAKQTVQILDRPGGSVIMELEEGTLVHVIIENEGWLHVVVPRKELTWQTDWDGTYGFVRTDDMAVGISKADVMWGN